MHEIAKILELPEDAAVPAVLFAEVRVAAEGLRSVMFQEAAAFCTTTTLLQGLHDPQNAAAWESFNARYRPIMISYARRLGFDDFDAADLAQDVLVRFLQEYRAGKYDRNRGTLRGWIITIVKYRALDRRRAEGAHRKVGGDTVLRELPDDQELTQIWENERRAEMLRQALQELRQTTRTTDRTIQAFEDFVLNGLSATDVSAKHEMTVEAIYVAKNRVAERLREILTRLEAAYDD